MLGDIADGFGLFGGVSGSECGGWLEELSSEVLQEPQSGAELVMVNPRQPRDARSRTAHTSDRQLVSPGRRPMTLLRRRVSPKVRSMNLECRTRVQCSRGKRR